MDLHVVLIHVVLDLIDKVKIQFIKLNEPECLVFKLQIRIKINKMKGHFKKNILTFLSLTIKDE